MDLIVFGLYIIFSTYHKRKRSRKKQKIQNQKLLKSKWSNLSLPLSSPHLSPLRPVDEPVIYESTRPPASTSTSHTSGVLLPWGSRTGRICGRFLRRWRGSTCGWAVCGAGSLCRWCGFRGTLWWMCGVCVVVVVVVGEWVVWREKDGMGEWRGIDIEDLLGVFWHYLMVGRGCLGIVEGVKIFHGWTMIVITPRCRSKPPVYVLIADNWPFWELSLWYYCSNDESNKGDKDNNGFVYGMTKRQIRNIGANKATPRKITKQIAIDV